MFSAWKTAASKDIKRFGEAIYVVSNSKKIPYDVNREQTMYEYFMNQ